MSFIFKKLSVILCCLFGLISISPATLAKPGDIFVYFFGKNYNPHYFPGCLICGKCGIWLGKRAGQFCCLDHCIECALDNIQNIEIPYYHHQCKNCYFRCKCGNLPEPSSAFCYSKQYGIFCFLKYDNGGDINTVFENAKKSGQLYCAYCMSKELKGNFSGTIFSNVPSKITYKIPCDFRVKSWLQGATCEVKFNQAFRLDNITDGKFMCHKCHKFHEPVYITQPHDNLVRQDAELTAGDGELYARLLFSESEKDGTWCLKMEESDDLLRKKMRGEKK